MKRSATKLVTITYNSTTRKFSVDEVLNTADPNTVAGLSWAAMLLPRLERGDIWDQIQTVGTTVEAPALPVFTCPSDTDLVSQPDVAGISYSANAGAWDHDGTTFLYKNGVVGDTVDNGLFFDAAEYARQTGSPTCPLMRFSSVKDAPERHFCLPKTTRSPTRIRAQQYFHGWVRAIASVRSSSLASIG